MNKLKLIVASMAVAGLYSVAPAQAAELFSNGTGITSGNNPFSNNNVFIAEDFTLGSAQTIKSLSFNAFVTGDTVPVTGVNVKFYSDSSGVPGAELFSGVFGVADSAVTGANAYYTFKDFFVNVGDVSLAAGSYWMGLQVDPAQWDMHWTISDSGAFGSKAMEGNGTGDFGSYGSYSWDHSFKLYDTAHSVAAVPEPETYAMMLAGLGLLGLARRRKQAKAA